MRLINRRLVGIKPEPLHALENRIDGRIGRSFSVGILDTQQKLPAAVAGEKPRIKRGPNTADVQVARGAGGETSANGHDGMRIFGRGIVATIVSFASARRT